MPAHDIYRAGMSVKLDVECEVERPFVRLLELLLESGNTSDEPFGTP